MGDRVEARGLIGDLPIEAPGATLEIEIMIETMNQTMLPTYNARIRFKTWVLVNAHRGNPWFAGAELRVQKRVMTDQIIAMLADNGDFGGVRWQQWDAVHRSLYRRGPNQ